jgi:hypothetical protein
LESKINLEVLSHPEHQSAHGIHLVDGSPQPINPGIHSLVSVFSNHVYCLLLIIPFPTNVVYALMVLFELEDGLLLVKEQLMF